MRLVDAWYEPSGRTRLWLWPLWPLALVLAALGAARRRVLERRRGNVAQLPPVVVIGNITLGGTGKTPLLIALARLLLSKGLRPGIVSRGYGGDGQPAFVLADSLPQQVGDEPILIRRQTACPVRVDANRLRAVQTLAAEHACDVILSDDGLQHHAMPRALELVVIDGERLLGNGHCLPAGPLREPATRLREVDWLVINGGPDDATGRLRQRAGLSEREPPVTAMRLQASAWVNLRSGQRLALADLPLEQGRALHAVAGIGNPGRFFDTLRALGLAPQCHAFADHHRFTAADLPFAQHATVLMTSKDAVKCEAFVGPHCWYLEVEAQLAPEFTQALLTAVLELVQARAVTGTTKN
jgi:tetraacyldisaccharide 4'-kinase